MGKDSTERFLKNEEIVDLMEKNIKIHPKAKNLIASINVIDRKENMVDIEFIIKHVPLPDKEGSVTERELFRDTFNITSCREDLLSGLIVYYREKFTRIMNIFDAWWSRSSVPEPDIKLRQLLGLSGVAIDTYTGTSKLVDDEDISEPESELRGIYYGGHSFITSGPSENIYDVDERFDYKPLDKPHSGEEFIFDIIHRSMEVFITELNVKIATTFNGTVEPHLRYRVAGGENRDINISGYFKIQGKDYDICEKPFYRNVGKVISNGMPPYKRLTQIDKYINLIGECLKDRERDISIVNVTDKTTKKHGTTPGSNFEVILKHLIPNLYADSIADEYPTGVPMNTWLDSKIKLFDYNKNYVVNNAKISISIDKFNGTTGKDGNYKEAIVPIYIDVKLTNKYNNDLRIYINASCIDYSIDYTNSINRLFNKLIKEGLYLDFASIRAIPMSVEYIHISEEDLRKQYEVYTYAGYSEKTNKDSLSFYDKNGKLI